MKEKLMKLFKDLMSFKKLETEQGILIYEGDVLETGTEVFIEDEGGNIVPAPDGTYGEYEVKDGKIAPKDEPEPEPETETPAEEEEMKETKKQECEEVESETEPETEPEPEPETETPDYEERISALEATVAELKALVDELKSIKEEQEFSSLQPAEKRIKETTTRNSRGSLKFFE